MPIIRRAFSAIACAALGLLLAGCGGADSPVQRSPAGAALRSVQAAAAQAVTWSELLAWAEASYPQLFSGAAQDGIYANYTYRHYPSTGNSIGLENGRVHILGPTLTGNAVQYVARLTEFDCRIRPDACDPSAPLATAAELAQRLGRPSRFLVGLGSGSSEASIAAQGLRPDIYEAYLVGVGSWAWPSWNSPAGAYVNVHAAKADRMGAVPMFTLYQMASWGDGNLWGLADTAFMTDYWSNVRLMFQRLALYGKPALVVVEPDFWGYVQHQGPPGDPASLTARVALVPECADLPDQVASIAGCMVRLRNAYAQQVLLGMMPSRWGAPEAQVVADFLVRAGGSQMDFVAMETLDRDAGCFEVQGPQCTRGGSGWYWDDAAYADHLAYARMLNSTLRLPLVWWQTPMGVPSVTPGGTEGAYRDNRMHYFMTRAPDLVAAGGLGAVYSQGASGQTGVYTDGGQFKRLSEQYFANPAVLP